MDSQNNRNDKKSWSFCSVVLFFSFMVFLFAPLEIYFSNKSEFGFNVYEMLPFILIGTVGSFCGIAFGIWIINRFLPRVAEVLVTLLLALSLALYIQGNFILVDYGQLNGETIDWSKFQTEGIISVAIWILIFSVALFLFIKVGYQKFLKAATILSLCIVLVQVVTLVTLFFTKEGFDKGVVYYASDKQEFDYSKDKNFTVIVLDTFDSQVFTDILNEDREYCEDVLKNFTYYQNTIGAYSTTDLAIPYMLTGECYLNEEPYGDYLNSAYKKSPLFNKLDELGWSTNVYTDITLPQSTVSNRINNFDKTIIGISSHKRLAGYMYKLVGFRYLPQPLKQYCWFYSDDMLEIKTSQNQDQPMYNWSNEKFYKGTEKISADSGAGIFHFYHLRGVHWPNTLDRNMQEVKAGTNPAEEGRGMLLMLDTYLNRLREEKVYDNSAIIIMADHGSNDEHQCPLLLVKGMDEKHDFMLSKAPVSYFDLQEAYSRLLDGKTGNQIFDAKEGMDRNRLFYRYKFTRVLESDVYAGSIREFTTTGDSFDFDSFVENGIIHEGREKSDEE